MGAPIGFFVPGFRAYGCVLLFDVGPLLDLPLCTVCTMSEYPLKPLQPTYADRFKLLTLSFPHPQVLHLQINMGPVNAFTAELSREYDEAFALIGDDPTVRAIVLSSALPKHFCAGIDLSFLAAICPPAPDPSRCALLQVVALQHATSTPSRCPIPVIAAVHGAALGLGLDLLGPVDIIYAASDAAFGAKQVSERSRITTSASGTNHPPMNCVLRDVPLVRKKRCNSAWYLRSCPAPARVSSRPHWPSHVLLPKIVHRNRRDEASTNAWPDHTVEGNLEYTLAWNAAIKPRWCKRLCVFLLPRPPWLGHGRCGGSGTEGGADNLPTTPSHADL